MKYQIILFLIFSLVSVCYADRICLEKATGKLIEMQSGNVNDPISLERIPPEEQVVYIAKIKFERLDCLRKNAINAGYKAEDIEVKEVTPQEWAVIKEKWIDKPARERAAQKEIIKKQKEQSIKQKLNLSEQDWKDLQEALGK